ncbi:MULTISPECIES: HU family DNA-binding protein [unclassified Acidithiobacillus]|uniref:HU family DNA-binding protein n=1 Tax=unclassified Acidithiobacillus TaxID=2614800 RepID=UPI001D0CF398|nr:MULTISPECIES: HU family DNA-binding protein [unclassified Acidithiobacillus]
MKENHTYFIPSRKKSGCTVTKDIIGHDLAGRMGFSIAESRLVVSCFFKLIIQTLASGEVVNLSGFGKFILREKSERVGRNPKSGLPALISARRVVVFKASQKIKKRCSSHCG